jgi:hypothetical protein
MLIMTGISRSCANKKRENPDQRLIWILPYPQKINKHLRLILLKVPFIGAFRKKYPQLFYISLNYHIS